MKKRINKAIVLFTSLLMSFNIYGQIYPVSTTTTLIPPYSAYLSDYYSSASNKLKVVLLFNDYNEQAIDVYLKLKIESQDIKIESTPNYKSELPITLIPGAPMEVSSTDLSKLFDFNNLNILGVNKTEFSQNGKLPEGFYSFSFEAYEYNSGKKVSNASVFYANIITIDPPIIQSPKCAKGVNIQKPQSILFQWQLLNTVSASLEYQLTLYEITEGNTDPSAAVDNNQAIQIYQSDFIKQSSFLYDSKYTELEAGKNYIFTVQAKDGDDILSFKNDGFSANCWFRYGFPSGGEISSVEPLNAHGFRAKDDRYFKWSAPDNMEDGQSVKYSFKIVEINENQDSVSAMTNNEAWFEEVSSPVFSKDPYSTMIQDKPFEKDKKYAWKVTAKTGEQLIAESPVLTFTGPPLIESFYVNNILVKVISLKTKDLSNLSGKGKFQISKDDKYIEVNFNHLSMLDQSGRYLLDKGEIAQSIDFEKMPLTPQFKRNGNAYFFPDSIKLNSQDGLQIGGTVKWDFPHPTTSGNKAEVSSAFTWYFYNDYELNGIASFNENNEYELLEPMNFKLNLLKKSDFLITKNTYKLRFYVEVSIPENVTGFSDKQVVIEFDSAEQIFYNNYGRIKGSNTVLLVSETSLQLKPTKITTDFSSIKSPPKLSSQKEWKGVYFDEYDLIFPQQFDNSKQISFVRQLKYQYKSEDLSTWKNWVSPQGLNFSMDYTFDEEGEFIKFNTFPAGLNKIKVEIENSKIKNGSLSGSFIIPFLSETARRKFTVPVEQDGFKPGYLDESLENFKVVFNPDGGEQKMNLTLLRGVFADNERLDLTLDVEIPDLNVTIKSITGFRIYGDMNIGFDKINGSKNLNQQVSANYKGYAMTIDKIGAAIISGNYALSFSAIMNLGDEMKGSEGGSPRLNISSVSTLDNPANVITANPPEIPIDISDDVAESKVFAIPPISIDVKTSIAEFKGELAFTLDDPDWGNSFQGLIKGKLKIPSAIDIGASMILGVTQTDLKYWYFDAYFNDQQGTGVPVFGFFNITAMEGRVYRHMNLNTKSGKFSVDEDIQFGAGLYLQIMDAEAQGHLFVCDIAAELEVVKGDFTVDLEGDLSALNVKGRSKTAGSSIKNVLGKEAAKQAAKQALSQLDDFSTTFDVNGGKLSLALGKTTSGIAFEKSSSKLSFDAINGSVPSATATLKLDDVDFKLTGNPSGSASFLLTKGSDKLNYSIANDSSTINLDVAGFKTTAGYNSMKKTNSFSLAFGDKDILLSSDLMNKSGKIKLKLDDSKSILASKNSEKGVLALNYDNSKIELEANEKENSAKFNVSDNNTDILSLYANQSAGTATLSTKSGNTKFSLEADKTGKGSLSIKDGRKELSLAIDKTIGSGSILIDDGDSKKFNVAIDGSGGGLLDLQYDDVRFALNGNSEEGSGSVFAKYEDMEILTEANKTSGIGKMVLRSSETDSFFGAISSTGPSVAYSYNGLALGVNANKNGAGDFYIKQGGNIFELGGDLDNKKANFKLSGSGQRMELAVNKPENTATIDFKINSDSFYASMAENKGYLGFAINGVNMTIDANSQGSGDISLQTGQVKLKVAVDKTTNKGAFHYSDGDLLLSINENKNFELGMGSSSIKVNFIPSGIKLIQDGQEQTIKYKNGIGTYTTKIDGTKIEFSSGSSSTFLKVGDKNDYVKIAADGSKNGSLEYKSGTTSYKAEYKNGDYTIYSGDKSIAITQSKKLILKDGTKKEISISDNDLVFKYNDYYASLGTTKIFSFTDGTYSFDLSTESISLSDNTKSLTLNSDKSVELKDGSSKSLLISGGGINFKYDKYLASYSSSKALSFSDGSRSFSISESEFSISDGSMKLGIVSSDGVKAVEYTEGENKLSVSSKGAVIKYGAIDLEIGKDKYLSTSLGDVDVSVSTSEVILEDGDLKIIFGGNTNLASLEYDNNSLAFTKSKDLVLTSGKYEGKLLSTNDIKLTDGTNTITTVGDDLIKYSNSSFSMGLFKSNIGYGIHSDYSDYKLSVEAGSKSKVKVGFESPGYGKYNVEVDANKNITAGFEIASSDLIVSKKSSGNIDVSGSLANQIVKTVLGDDVKVEGMDGYETPDMKGPKYLTKKITDDAGGFLKANVRMSYNSAESHLICTGGINGKDPICIEAAFGLDVKGSTYKLEIGKKEKPVKLALSCNGWGGMGWFYLDNKVADVAIGAGFKAGGSLDLGVIELWAKVDASLMAEVAFQYQPSFKFKKAALYAHFYGGCGGSFDFGIYSESFTLAEIELTGELVADFEKSVISGDLDGHVEALGGLIDEDFSMGFSMDI